eukprot:2176422-Prymnesium_polylepis.1
MLPPGIEDAMYCKNGDHAHEIQGETGLTGPAHLLLKCKTTDGEIYDGVWVGTHNPRPDVNAGEYYCVHGECQIPLAPGMDASEARIITDIYSLYESLKDEYKEKAATAAALLEQCM